MSGIKANKMESLVARFRSALDMYLGAFAFDVLKYASRNITLTLPIMETDLLFELFNHARTIFSDEPTLLTIQSPCIVVGDIHGQILDLIRILKQFGLPDKQRYVFLGDIVDRGEFSVETLVSVLLLKVIWPDNVFIIRGNHEFQFLCSQCGFMSQMIACFDNPDLYQASAVAFDHLPLAVLIDNEMLCVHGGIGPLLTRLEDIRTIARPVEDYGDDVLDSLVWSDPSEDVCMFEPSARGTGYLFGRIACDEFLTRNNLSMIIRGHECVQEGCRAQFYNQCLTVFSASNYCGITNNQAGVLEITSVNTWQFKTFPPLPWLERKHVMFKEPGKRLNDKAGTRRGRLRTSESAKLQQLKEPVLPMMSKLTQSVTALPRLIGNDPVELARKIRIETAMERRSSAARVKPLPTFAPLRRDW